MENRKEFERFAALYFDQWVYYAHDLNQVMRLNGCYLEDRIKKDYLQLRSIESLTDEEVLSFQRGTESADWCRAYVRLAISHKPFPGYRTQQIVDKLRSIGIAVPFMQYSVEDMVKMGWIKIV